MNRMLATALLLALSATAYAKDGGKDTFAVCRADVDRLCKNVQPGEGRQVQCIVSNRANLSGDCAALVTRKLEKEQQMQGQKQKVKHPQ